MHGARAVPYCDAGCALARHRVAASLVTGLCDRSFWLRAGFVFRLVWLPFLRPRSRSHSTVPHPSCNTCGVMLCPVQCGTCSCVH